MILGGISDAGEGGVRQTRFPHSDCLGIRNRETVENPRIASGSGVADVEIDPSGTCCTIFGPSSVRAFNHSLFGMHHTFLWVEFAIDDSLDGHDDQACLG